MIAADPRRIFVIFPRLLPATLQVSRDGNRPWVTDAGGHAVAVHFFDGDLRRPCRSARGSPTDASHARRRADVVVHVYLALRSGALRKAVTDRQQRARAER